MKENDSLFERAHINRCLKIWTVIIEKYFMLIYLFFLARICDPGIINTLLSIICFVVFKTVVNFSHFNVFRSLSSFKMSSYIEGN